MNFHQLKSTLSLAISAFIAVNSAVALGVGIATIPFFNTEPALAGIFDGLKLPTPTGIYLEINGKKFYLGDYSENPNLEFPGSKWEIKVDHHLWAHGYGQTPGWVLNMAKSFFGSIPVE